MSDNGSSDSLLFWIGALFIISVILMSMQSCSDSNKFERNFQKSLNDARSK